MYSLPMGEGWGGALEPMLSFCWSYAYGQLEQCFTMVTAMRYFCYRIAVVSVPHAGRGLTA
ncbi:MAG: hypothetical protein IKX25_07130 [Bacteroidales bacterium]|nr:hypothetical protein [Bacteroidales bacterium]